MFNQKLFAATLSVGALLFSGAKQAEALTITGTVGSKYLLTGSPVNTTTPAVLKIAFETTTSGENLALCAGSSADFAAGKCAIPLSDSGGPGFTFLTIVDAATLNGKILFVLREVGVNPASFKVTIE